jgi:hypothetical protein
MVLRLGWVVFEAPSLEPVFRGRKPIAGRALQLIALSPMRILESEQRKPQ